MKIVGRVWTPSIYVYGLAWLGPRLIVGEAERFGLFALDPVALATFDSRAWVPPLAICRAIRRARST
jgi:hypothetical protein